jgi:hypothetical protein
MSTYRVLIVADDPIYLEHESVIEAGSPRSAEKIALADFNATHDFNGAEVASEETFNLDAEEDR